MKPPAARPCGSCPYRQDAPSGLWAATEYEKLPEFDGQTHTQPPKVFLCHQNDDSLCAGWVACHDMEQSLGLRIAAAQESLTEAEVDAVIDYTTDVPVFSSGAEAAAHGLRDLEHPAPSTTRYAERLSKRTTRR